LLFLFLCSWQALACVQTLCKASKQMAQCLVDRDLHILLFTLLYHDESDAGTRTTSFLETSEDTEEKVNNCESVPMKITVDPDIHCLCPGFVGVLLL